MPYKLKDPVRHKFAKKSYNKRDWKAYEEGLRNRGDLTIWFCEDAVAAWNHCDNEKRKRGRQRQYSDLAIETSHTIRLVYKQALRQTEGLMRSIVRSMKLDLAIPDHTTLSRRSRRVLLRKKPLPKGSVVIIVDSTGLKVVGEKEWMNHKHGTRQRKVWRKLHLCINEYGEILSATLTSHIESDTGQVGDLLETIEGPVSELIGDGGYDNPSTYEALEAYEKRSNQNRPIKAIIPPNTGFQEAKETDSAQRLGNIHLIEDKGKLSWQNQMDYGRRARVENTMHRYKSIIGNKLRSKTFESQNTEVQIAARILNRMAHLGMPKAQKAA
jgi:Transposase DDE domain